MKEATIRDAKARLAGWVREVERGQRVRLTRRGRPVAVLVSERDFARLVAAASPRADFLRFLQGWRREMIAKGIPFADRRELAAMRDRRPARRSSFRK